jgi:hypothetical protein
MFEEEISPEELFQRFFNSGFGGMGGGLNGFGKFTTADTAGEEQDTGETMNCR